MNVSEGSVDLGRRRFLVKATSSVMAVGGAAAAVPFVKSWLPSAKAKAAGAPVKIDISKLSEGEILGPIPAWRGKPIFVLKRSSSAIDSLLKEQDRLRDPSSEETQQQPEYARNVWRSRDKNIGVYVGLCTHLGCSPTYYGKVKPELFDSNWKGGFYCPCHGSKFDLAGRVYDGVPAPTNLEVPPYMYLSDKVIIIGLDEASS